MKELNIKNITMEEFKNLYNIVEESEMPKSYPVSELGAIMAKGEDKIYYLIVGTLYEEPKKDIKTDEVSKNDKEAFESLHDKFRDALVDYRDFLCHKGGKENSAEAMQIQKNMAAIITDAKNIVSKYNVQSEEDIKLMSKKFFIPDFISAILGTETFNDAYDIDCGL